MAQITTAEAAAHLETDGRTLRKFLRATVPTDEHPGKGARWAIEGNKRALTKLSKSFAEWSETQSKPAEKPAPEVEEPIDDADLDSNEGEEEPTDEALELEDEVDLDD